MLDELAHGSERRAPRWLAYAGALALLIGGGAIYVTSRTSKPTAAQPTPTASSTSRSPQPSSPYDAFENGPVPQTQIYAEGNLTAFPSGELVGDVGYPVFHGGALTPFGTVVLVQDNGSIERTSPTMYLKLVTDPDHISSLAEGYIPSMAVTADGTRAAYALVLPEPVGGDPGYPRVRVVEITLPLGEVIHSKVVRLNLRPFRMGYAGTRLLVGDVMWDPASGRTAMLTKGAVTATAPAAAHALLGAPCPRLARVERDRFAIGNYHDVGCKGELAAFAPDGRYVAVAAPGDGILTIALTESGMLVQAHPLAGLTQPVWESPTSVLLATEVEPGEHGNERIIRCRVEENQCEVALQFEGGPLQETFGIVQPLIG